MLAGTGSCKSHREAEVAGVWIPQAEGLYSLPKGDLIAVTRSTAPASLGKSADVGLAIARDVPWSKVRKLRNDITASGRRPHLVVADGRKVGAFRLSDELIGVPIRVRVDMEGKLCVSPPNTPEAKCVQRVDKRHVDQAFTRELVREAVREYKLHDVVVEVPSALGWADVVRAVDGSRTCCYDEKVRVRLKQ